MDRQGLFAWLLIFLFAMFLVFAIRDMRAGDQGGLSKMRDFLLWALVAVTSDLLGRDPS